jgi:DNA-directed RNA polymerase subunit M/transcription elongation factor TFIIS
MSRNKSRISVPQQPTPKQKAPIPQPTKNQDNPFGLSFVVPTEIVKLPSSGYIYSENSPLKGITEVEVKAVTAAEEDIMINDSFIQQGIVFDRLIDSIMITPGIRAQDLMDCDKMAILMSARKTGYGDNINFNVECGSCRNQYEIDVSLTGMIEETENNPYRPSSGDGWEYLEESNTFSFDLPTSNLNVNIKLLTPEEISKFEASRIQKEKLGLPFNETIEFLRAVLVSAQGVTDRSPLNKLAEVLPAADARRIRLIHNTNLPKVKTNQEVVCPRCGHEEQKEVPFSLGWFWSQ